MENPYLASPEPELLLSIRFSASLPDVLLEIPSPRTTTTAGLKQLIRARLPPELSKHRLRLIYSGKALEDVTPLSTSLRLSSFAPFPSHESAQSLYGPGSSQSPALADSDDEENQTGDKKGKAPIRNEPQPRTYIHCSIGDVVLSASDLAAESSIASTLTASKAKNRTASAHSQSAGTHNDYELHHDHSTTTAPPTTTTPAPRGFDRLLSAGLTDTEISALRAQFLSNFSLTRTPDTMPSAAELRIMEERWLDNSDSGNLSMGQGGGGGGGAVDYGGTAAVLDDMLWGSVMGFFWPVGCSIWLLREDGVWSWRKGLAVFIGVVINLLLGTIRVMG
ncbi:hypothetical protein FQN54_000325 [Arachnomyces sp. PD_36]|nr:hypothetical protein FQN54_000325 [Arachnomyces sp. PD_36]